MCGCSGLCSFNCFHEHSNFNWQLAACFRYLSQNVTKCHKMSQNIKQSHEYNTSHIKMLLQLIMTVFEIFTVILLFCLNNFKNSDHDFVFLTSIHFSLLQLIDHCWRNLQRPLTAHKWRQCWGQNQCLCDTFCDEEWKKKPCWSKVQWLILLGLEFKF